MKLFNIIQLCPYLHGGHPAGSQRAGFVRVVQPRQLVYEGRNRSDQLVYETRSSSDQLVYAERSSSDQLIYEARSRTLKIMLLQPILHRPAIASLQARRASTAEPSGGSSAKRSQLGGPRRRSSGRWSACRSCPRRCAWCSLRRFLLFFLSSSAGKGSRVGNAQELRRRR